MASTETRPSFRLPWSTGPAESDERRQTDVEPAETPAETSMESGDMHDSEESQATEMIETAPPATAPSDAEPSGAAPARRATKFMAELSHAMQAAAEHARNETMERFQAEAKTVVEEIHAGATTEVAELRRKADEDLAAIRDWSKAEIARIREETESRVAARKNGLDSEIEAHAATVDARAERVTAVVAAFEAEMSVFFDRLNAEEDPTRIATMAETMPDPPSLEVVAASIVMAESPAPVAATLGAVPEAVHEPVSEPEPEPEPEPATAPEPEPAPAAEIDFAAAEAEAMSFDGDLTSADEIDGSAAETTSENPELAEATEAPAVPAFDATPGAQASTRVVVAGLISVASIANFKRSLARIPGVWSIGVSSGPEGDFVFTVSHDGSLALSREIESISAFESQVTSESDDEIQVSAHDRDAVG
jgi:hypothetical protein